MEALEELEAVAAFDADSGVRSVAEAAIKAIKGTTPGKSIEPAATTAQMEDVLHTAPQPKADTKPADPEAMSVVYFLDPADQKLKPLPKETAKVVAKRSGFTGVNGIIQIPGGASSFRVRGGSDLVFVVKCTSPESYDLYLFEKKKDKREALVAKGKAGFRGGSTQKVGTVPLDVSKYGEMSYRFAVRAPEPGEYGFPMKWDVYHFAVD